MPLVRSACPFDCPDACGLLIDVEDGRARAVRGDPEHPWSRGTLCSKMNGYERSVAPRSGSCTLSSGPAQGAGRSPRMREEAIALVAARIRGEYGRRDGAEAILPDLRYAGSIWARAAERRHGVLPSARGVAARAGTICTPAQAAGRQAAMLTPRAHVAAPHRPGRRLDVLRQPGLARPALPDAAAGRPGRGASPRRMPRGVPAVLACARSTHEGTFEWNRLPLRPPDRGGVHPLRDLLGGRGDRRRAAHLDPDVGARRELPAVPHASGGSATVHTNGLTFGLGVGAIFGLSYWIVMRLCKRPLVFPKLARVQLWLFNVGVALAALSLLAGHTQSLEYAELEWPLDIAIVVLWLMFAVNVFATIIKRNEEQMYVSLWFIIATVIAVAVLYLVNNLAIPASLTKSYHVFAGVNSANVQWWYGHNAVGFVFTTPILAMFYYFLPKSTGLPIYSHRLSIIAFWSLVFAYLWTGAHHLVYTPLPDWIQTLAIAFTTVPHRSVLGLGGERLLHRGPGLVEDAVELPDQVLHPRHHLLRPADRAGADPGAPASSAAHPLHRLGPRPRAHGHDGLGDDDRLRVDLLRRSRRSTAPRYTA